MIIKLWKKFWTHLLITFDDNYTAEGFERTNRKFELPENLSQLDPATKRKLTICNLFANQNLSIAEIVRVLDSTPHQVVPTLIEHQLIKERRRKKRGNPEAGRGNPLSLLASEEKEETPRNSEEGSERTMIDGSRPSRYEEAGKSMAASAGATREGESIRASRRTA